MNGKKLKTQKMYKIPRKLKKELLKIEKRVYQGTWKEELVVIPNVKINKWTLKLFNKIKEEMKRAEEYRWKTICEEMFKKK